MWLGGRQCFPVSPTPRLHELTTGEVGPPCSVLEFASRKTSTGLIISLPVLLFSSGSQEPCGENFHPTLRNHQNPDSLEKAGEKAPRNFPG